MALRAKKPEVKDARLKTLIYGGPGVGKTHFCCSIPDTYYIDTEGLEDYPHLVKMLRDNGGEIIHLSDLSEIIKEVKELLSTKHNYKTLIIDSISFPYAWLAQLEVERLTQKNPHTEGTEFGANIAKSKRLIFQLGILLSRLDMNVIVCSHERIKYEKDKEIGKTYDVSDKLAYSLGSYWNIRLFGDKRKVFIEKTRYAELKTGQILDFDNGYETIKSLFGELVFKRQSKLEELATQDQILEFERLVNIFKVTEESIQKWIMNSKSSSIKDMPRAYIQKIIETLQKRAMTINTENDFNDKEDVA